MTYPDQTAEETKFVTGSSLVSARKNRAGQWTSYRYGKEGRLESAHLGETAQDGNVAIRYEYAPDGSISAVRNADSAIEYECDVVGRVEVARTIRYANGTGISATPATREVLDTHTQTYVGTVGATPPPGCSPSTPASLRWSTYRGFAAANSPFRGGLRIRIRLSM